MNIVSKYSIPVYAPEGAGSGASEGAPAASPAAPASPATTSPSSSPSGAASSTPSVPPSSPAPSGSPTPVAPPEAPARAGQTVPPGSAPAPGGVDPSMEELLRGLEGRISEEEYDQTETPPLATPPVMPPVVPPQEAQALVAPPVAPQQQPELQPPQQLGQQQPPSQAPGPQDATSPLLPAEPGRLASLMAQSEPQLVNHLAATAFQLSQEDLQALETDAPGHIPKLLAKVYLRSQVNMMQQLERYIPAMLQRYAETAQKVSANEGKFYQRWPDIKQAQHGELVRRYAQVYRASNPQASMEQMIEDLGPMVMMAARIVPQPQPNGGMRTPPAGFRPAIGGSMAAPPPQTEQNPWEGLAPSQSDE